MNILQSWPQYVLKAACKVLHIFFAAQLPRHFVLIPSKSIYVLQRQSGEVVYIFRLLEKHWFIV